MNWSGIAESVSKFAPAIGGVLAGPAGAAAGTVLASVLGTDDSPEAVAAAIQADPEAAAKIRQAELEHATQMRKLLLESRTAEQAEKTARMAEINKTMRAELAHDGWWRAGWRPAVGWVMALSVLAIVGGLVASLVREPGQIEPVVDAIIALVVVMGPVLGVNIHQRSRDKQVAAGIQPAGLLQSLLGRRDG